MTRSLTARNTRVASATRRKSTSAESATAKSLSADIAPAIELLKKLATYELEAGVDRFMLDLGENKDSLNGVQHHVLTDLVEFTQRRTIEKFEARVALQRLKHLFPRLVGGQ